MPTFWFFGAPTMLATARGAKRHLGELHVSGSKSGILRPSRLRPQIPYGFRRLRRGLKTKYSVAFESHRLLCQTIPSAHEQGAGQKAGQKALPMTKTRYIQVTTLIYWKIYSFWFWKARHGQKIAARGFWRSLLGKSAGQNEIASPIY